MVWVFFQVLVILVRFEWHQNDQNAKSIHIKTQKYSYYPWQDFFLRNPGVAINLKYYYFSYMYGGVDVRIVRKFIWIYLSLQLLIILMRLNIPLEWISFISLGHYHVNMFCYQVSLSCVDERGVARTRVCLEGGRVALPLHLILS